MPEIDILILFFSPLNLCDINFPIALKNFYLNSSRRKIECVHPNIWVLFCEHLPGCYVPLKFLMYKPSKSATVPSLTYIWSINLLLKMEIRQGKPYLLSFEVLLAFICSFLLFSALIALIVLSFLFLGNYTWFVSDFPVSPVPVCSPIFTYSTER